MSEQKPERQHVSDAAYVAYTRTWHTTVAQADMETTCRLDGTVLLTIAEHDELLALRAEVERLRNERAKDGKFIEAFGYVTTLHPTMEIDIADPMGMARKIVDFVNERLRKGRDDGTTMERLESRTRHAEQQGQADGPILSGVSRLAAAMASEASAKTRRQWIEHDGTKCPVVSSQWVHVRRRHGGESDRPCQAISLGFWTYPAGSTNVHDITHYMLVESRPTAGRIRELTHYAKLAEQAFRNGVDHRLGLGLPDGEPVEPMSARSWKRGRW